jgi:hypothetical protein
MIATTHPVSPEEVMALLDGELAPADASAVSTHLAECPECASLAAQLRDTSDSLSQWTVQPVSTTLEEAVMSAATKSATGSIPAKSSRNVGPGLWKWNLWATGGGRAVAAIAILLVVSSTIWVFTDQPFRRQRMVSYVAPGASSSASQPLPAPPPPASESPAPPATQKVQFAASASSGIVGGYSPAASRARQAAGLATASTSAPQLATQTAPMIAHSVSLTVQVRDLSSARAALEALLARHHGYAAQLTVNTAEGSSRNLQSSLRIPDSELASAIAEMRALGRVETETQSGEEVTQQHADLVARLQNSRETEQRLRDLLAQRTGKIDEVLQVEEEIARVRGQIEEMEAQQKVLEHRVDFATIELQLTEQYLEQLAPQSTSVPMQIRNSFVAGLRHAANTLLRILLFVEEVGPTMLIWLAILGVPAFFLWRRYQRLLHRP